MSMHLTDLRIDAFGSVRNIRLQKLGRGFTGVYGSNGSGKTSVLQFLRGTFGDRSASFWDHAHTTPSGHIDVLTKEGRQQVGISGKSHRDIFKSSTLARLATVTASEANDTALVERLADQLGVSLEDTTVDLSAERKAHAELVAECSALTSDGGPIAQAEAELARIDQALAAAQGELQRTQDRLAAQHKALQAAFASTLRDVNQTHGDYQAAQCDLTSWQTDAWRPRRTTTSTEQYEAAVETAPRPATGTDLKAALLEIAHLRCKASARRAEAAAGGPLDLCNTSLSKPLQIADELRESLDRLRNAAGTVPAAGLSARVEDLIASLSQQQRAVDWLQADHTRVLLDRCERDLEKAALRSCSVCASGHTACDSRDCQTTATRTRTIETVEAPADAALGARLGEAQATQRLRWQSALARHRQAHRHLLQFEREQARLASDERIARLLAERDAAASQLAALHQRLLRLKQSIAELEAVLAEDRAPSGPLVDAGSYFRQLTCGHYLGLVRGRDRKHELRATTSEGHSVAMHELSRGTQSQAALAMRLAILDELGKRGEVIPLILDDVLVDSDRDRANAAVKLLADWSAHRQTILMTCQRQLIDAMRDQDIAIETLGSTSVAPGEPRRESVVTQMTVKPSPAAVQLAVSRAVGDSSPKANVISVTSRKTTSSRTNNVEPTTPTYWLDADSMIVRLLSVTETDARRLRSIGIESVEHLVLADAADIEADLVELQINPRSFIRWQSEARLMTLIPGLSARDAQLLAWAGLQEPHQLAAIDTVELRRRLQGLANDSAASHLRIETESFSNDRLNRWRARAGRARSGRSTFRNRPTLRSVRESRRDRSREQRSGRSSDRGRTLSVVERRRSMRRDSKTSPRGASRKYDRSSQGDSNAAVVTTMARTETVTATTTEWRHYLETSSPVVDAPSIGPKMSKRLGKQGIKTVADLLAANPGRVAAGLDDRRIKKQTIIDWQDQARLMCRIPMLRGHDVQVLVACDYRDVEKVAASSPNAMFNVIGPFVKTKEAERLLRSSKVPDLAEVTDWINWARHARALKAA